MMRSLFSGVSGLRNHQVRMDVIGNNVSNVNTVAFKTGRVTFKEGFAQLLQGASRPPGDHGGINPIQIGLGMQIGSIDTLFSQGNLETTGLNTDLAIQGYAFF
jgi:flagellar hook protein FlgE